MSGRVWVVEMRDRDEDWHMVDAFSGRQNAYLRAAEFRLCPGAGQRFRVVCYEPKRKERKR